MNKMMIRVVALGASMLGILVLVLAIGNKLARWGGYAQTLPWVGLLVLFVAGQLVVSMAIRRRS